MAARLTCRGTHRGPIFGAAPTGKTVVYDGLALFRIDGAKIVEGYVLGNVLRLFGQLGIQMPAASE